MIFSFRTAHINSQGSRRDKMLIDWFKRNKKGRCRRCGRKLTDQEKEYYTSHCEKCERYFMKTLNKELQFGEK